MAFYPYTIQVVRSEPELALTRRLLQAYAASLEIDLGLEGFEQELAELPGTYAPPRGDLWLATGSRGEGVGCVAFRGFGDADAEMKRLYVEPAMRGSGLGRLLVQQVIEKARRLGRKRLLLDTLPSMDRAIGLYRRLGFYEIEPYYPDPLVGALFLALDLSQG